MTNATARGADRERVRSLSLEAMPMKQFLVLSKSSVRGGGIPATAPATRTIATDLGVPRSMAVAGSVRHLGSRKALTRRPGWLKRVWPCEATIVARYNVARAMRPRPTSRHPHTFSACLSWLIVCALMAIAPPVARAERLPIRVYTSADGLPHDRISQIVRDSHGFLWFCTAAGGLSRFDGARFTTYSRAEDFPHHSINGILEDTDGTYWIATNGGGVYHFDLHPRRDRRRP